MNMVIAALMFVALLAVSMAHFLWSIGSTWPIRDEQLLARTVVGTANVQKMPSRFASLLLAIAILAGGVVALSLADPDGGGPTLSVLGILGGLIFLVRGIVGFTPWFTAKTPDPIFRLIDRRVYSPLCLALGVGFIALVVMRLL